MWLLTPGRKDIHTCQQKGKTILLSIGGATYSEGGFKSEADAKDGAKLIWETFGPKQAGSKALRPFGDVSLDGFDFDFEANVEHMAPFANELRSLMDQESDRQYFLTAAPQCPYPDQADKDILNGPVSIDAIWVQFYNNFCGVNNFDTDPSASQYNFEEWDNWAKTVSQNPNVKVLVGVPADTTAASTGYVPADKLAEVIEYSKSFDSFGGVMMWDATQAEANDGYLQGVRNALGGGDSGSSSSPNSASTTASAPSSTNSPNTSLSSNAPASSSSSSSCSGSGSSSSGLEHLPTDTPAPKPTVTPTTLATKPTVAPSPKPQPESAPTTKPTSTSTLEPTPTTAPSENPTTSSSTSETQTPSLPHPSNVDTGSDLPSSDNQPVTGVNNSQGDSDDSKDAGPIHSLLTGDLFGLLDGLRQANGVVSGVAGGVTHGLTKNLRRANRIQ